MTDSQADHNAPWRAQRSLTIRTADDLPPDFRLFPHEREFFRRAEGAGVPPETEAAPEKADASGAGPAPQRAAASEKVDASGAGPAPQRAAASGTEPIRFAVTPYYLSLAGQSPDDPVRLQCIPRGEEYKALSYETPDPLSDLKYSPCDRLVHRYRDRVLILVTDECAVYCRHCFRRHFSSRRNGALTNTQLKGCVDYIRSRPEVHEVLLSGGDPLTLDDERLLRIILEISDGVPRPLVFRLATRVPVVMPQRITAGLADRLGEIGALFVVTQFNHPREITPESREAVRRLVEAGIPVMNQAVLLREVNDSLETLAALFQGLLEIRVKPYYLFQGDLASGTSHFRVPLSRGLELVRELRNTISGLAMPVYAVDLPRGGGKIPLTESRLEEVHDEDGTAMYRFRGADGLSYCYPSEPL